MEIGTTDPKPHVALLSSPGMGHRIPIIELSKRLVTNHNVGVTIFVVPSQSSAAESEVLQSAMSSKLCEIIELPPVDISELVNPDAAVVTLLCVIMREIKPALRSAISGLSLRPSALIVDLFGTEAMVVADEFQIPKYVYVPSNAWFLALQIYTPVLDQVVQGQFVDEKEPLQIPGCRSVRPEDVVDPMLDRTNQQYFEYLRMGVEMPMCNGILLNIWEDLQPKTLEALRDEKLFPQLANVPIYPIGPLKRPTKPLGSSSGLFIWLDNQPSESVIYVSFGSGGTLSFEQMTELARGIELSQQRFIWVIRSPTVKTGDGFFWGADEGKGMLSYLPDGFLNRTQHIGLIVKNWAPQVEILSHPSIGGFLSHCGWNSTLESITNGVPMITWPLYAEQRMNATLLSEELGVAIRPTALPSKDVVRGEEIEMMIRRIMVDKEGDKIRNRVKEIKGSAEKALSEGGSSYDALSELAKECEKSWKCQKIVAPQAT